MKDKLQEAYDKLDDALSTACGSWKTIAEVYEDAMVEAMDLLLEVIKND